MNTTASGLQIPPIQSRTERVLIVDDNPDHTILASTSLERHGWPRVDSVTTLATAFDTIRQHHYDLVLIDYCLPDGFGLDLIDWIRKDSAVVIMTGMGSEEIAAEAIKSGAVDYLVKNSIFPDVLPDVASRAIERFRSQTQSRTVSQSGKRTLRVLTAAPKPEPVLAKTPDTESLIIQTVSRIRAPLAQALADGSSASSETQAKRLKIALANCDAIVDMINQASKRNRPQ